MLVQILLYYVVCINSFLLGMTYTFVYVLYQKCIYTYKETVSGNLFHNAVDGYPAFRFETVCGRSCQYSENYNKRLI